MFDSIFIGASGMQSFSTGLKVISNNVANLNTPGFKSSEVQFANLFYQTSGSTSGAGYNLFGSGVMAGQTFIDFQAGETRQTGNPLDLSIGGDGFFVTRDAKDQTITYSRAGQFEFDKDGFLVARGTGRQAQGLGAGGALAPISINGLRLNPPKPTSQIKLTGNLSTGSTEFTLDAVKVIDAVGGEHTLKLTFKPKANEEGTWTVSVLDGDTEVSSAEVKFLAGTVLAGSDQFTFAYAPAGMSSIDVKVDLSKDVTSFNTGTTSSLAVGSTDGHAVGSLTQVAFDGKGVLSLTYSNGEKVTGQQLALAAFDTTEGLRPAGEGEFTHPGNEQRHLGTASSGRFGSIVSSQVEVSNVDLSSEFSDLIVTQRGYQASSRLVSTANEMLQDLFEMKGHR